MTLWRHFHNLPTWLSAACPRPLCEHFSIYIKLVRLWLNNASHCSSDMLEHVGNNWWERERSPWT